MTDIDIDIPVPPRPRPNPNPAQVVGVDFVQGGDGGGGGGTRRVTVRDRSGVRQGDQGDRYSARPSIRRSRYALEAYTVGRGLTYLNLGYPAFQRASFLSNVFGKTLNGLLFNYETMPVMYGINLAGSLINDSPGVIGFYEQYQEKK